MEEPWLTKFKSPRDGLTEEILESIITYAQARFHRRVRGVRPGGFSPAPFGAFAPSAGAVGVGAAGGEESKSDG